MLRAALIPLFALTWSGIASGQSCGCEVSGAKEDAYNDLLNLSAAEIAAAKAVHLPFGAPVSKSDKHGEHFLHQEDYITYYDDDLRVPLWVAYRLTRADLAHTLERTECFRTDPRLSSEQSATCNDYDEPVFDRGHLVPNADMERSEPAMINTYMFSNMTPQHDKFNRGIWARLEGYVRDWAEQRGEIYVVTGAIFDADGDTSATKKGRDSDISAKRMNDRVGVPTHFYKVLFVRIPNQSIESMAFLLPHSDRSPSGKKDSDAYLNVCLVSIDEIEQRAGLDFFPGLSDSREKAAEAKKPDAFWALD